MKIIVREVEGHQGIYDVFVGAEKLCRSRLPLLAAALAMWREGVTVPAIIPDATGQRDEASE